ncbi:hypothetical protein AS850_15695 [Frondihabitans sp. 762G35]|uniref:DoxX family protein n=1 Tax=Frondihabitans sp. 762G35 TaxID=1446794 RepID=UPI000D21E60C|nr:hypothetical protein [Frondihabitans sp. 762G35]ARC58531.1 hypothetical protein AS850_15695 [Frondihabitans sp. 762G35]
MSTRTSIPRTIARVTLGGVLAFAGVTHLTSARESFQAQVPEWVPLPKDTVVLASGVVEIALGSGLVLLGGHQRGIGNLAALFFTAIFPGNISQFVTKTSALGLDTDRKRAVRLVFQPLLVAVALWSTRAPKR